MMKNKDKNCPYYKTEYSYVPVAWTTVYWIVERFNNEIKSKRHDLRQEWNCVNCNSHFKLEYEAIN